MCDFIEMLPEKTIVMVDASLAYSYNKTTKINYTNIYPRTIRVCGEQTYEHSKEKPAYNPLESEKEQEDLPF